MKKIRYVVFMTLLVGVFCLEVLGIAGLKYYINPRYGFSIEYPDVFTEQQFSDNGDGIILTNIDKGIQLIVYGSNNIEQQTPQEAYIEILSQTPSVTQSSFRNNEYQLRWEEEGRQFVLQVRVGKGSKNGFRLSYPTSEGASYEEVVGILLEHFKTPHIDEIH